jgi:hypothetical protein
MPGDNSKRRLMNGRDYCFSRLCSHVGSLSMSPDVSTGPTQRIGSAAKPEVEVAQSQMVAKVSEVGGGGLCLWISCGLAWRGPRTDVLQHPMAPTSTLEIAQTGQGRGPWSARDTPMDSAVLADYRQATTGLSETDATSR